MADLQTKLKEILGDRTAAALASGFGMETLEDLLRHYPRRYVVRGELSDISALGEGDEVTVLAQVDGVGIRRVNGRNLLEVTVTDGTSKLSLTFFNQPWRQKELSPGRTGLFAGKIGIFKGKRQLTHPDYQMVPDGDDVDAAVADFAGKYLPVYPATAKLPSWKISQCIALALDSLDEVEDYLPSAILIANNFPTKFQALTYIHQPEDLDQVRLAQERLTFDEALLLQMILVQRRSEIGALAATPRPRSQSGLVAEFEAQLPFSFTQGQREVSAEIESDMQKPHPMHRLLQGEVGSGKTVLALRAMLTVIESGGQAALLAPTEVLAQQHFKSINKILGPLALAGTLEGNGSGTQLALLTGSLSAAAKKESLSKIASGEAGIVIGTHALLSEGVEFKDLALVVIDEQHRFGVEQRDALRGKAKLPPHVLVMTATPIPRTVAMTIFGDLDFSTLRELPAGRTPIQTHVVSLVERPQYLERAWARAREEVEKGHQVYIVAPRIHADEEQTPTTITDRDRAMAKLMGETLDEEELDDAEGSSAVEELAPQLATGPLKGLKLAVLHGKLSAQDKEDTMAAFSKNDISVLVATTVIEVGVDVPNASMMIIMDADRFGVSQLHQLRGRVGRGKVSGLCLLVSKADPNSLAMDRLSAVASTLDGFELSRIDLDQRREGDVLGKAQSGTRSHLRLLRVLRDERIIETARSTAIALVSEDSTLETWPQLAAAVKQLRSEESSQFVDKG